MKRSDKEDIATQNPEFQFTTARTHYINRLDSIERLSTGSKNIDGILYGGVETKALTEFHGPPSSGKTQLCHTMCAIVSQDKSKGGVCGKSIYIDTEGTFRAERIIEIAKARGFDPNMILDNVVILEPQNTKKQEQVIKKIDSLLKSKSKTERFKLLIVDSPVTHYRSEYTGLENLRERQQKLNKFIHTLATIARTYNLAVVVTNHINTIPDSEQMFGKRIGGNIMGHAVTYGIYLSIHPGGVIHYARILDSPYHPEKDTIFYIRDKGVVDN
jgi:DNA repair protein RadA